MQPAIQRNPAPLTLDFGCGVTSWTDYRYTAPRGDVIPESYISQGVTQAWGRTQGDNVTVAIIDTGVDPAQDQFFSQFSPATGPPRVFTPLAADGSTTWNDVCGHGTRVVGVIGAPHDGLGMVGIAWASDVVSIRSHSSVIVWDSQRIHDAVVLAAARGARVVQMAFGMPYNGDDLVADAIAFSYAQPTGPLFIAAIGNSGDPNATFPAEMDEVVAVVAMSMDGQRMPSSSWGPAAEVAAKVPVAAPNAPTLFGTNALAQLSMTSGASSQIAGIAALVFSIHPTWRNTDVRTRLHSAASHPFERNWQNGYGDVNAFKAVGGFTRLVVGGKSCVSQYEPDPVLNAVTEGDGPFSYLWSTGEQTNSILARKAPPGGSVSYSLAVTDLIDGTRRSELYTITTLPADDPRDRCEGF